MKSLKILLITSFIFSLTACESTSNKIELGSLSKDQISLSNERVILSNDREVLSNKTQESKRTLSLGEHEFSENDFLFKNVWTCEFLFTDKVIVEVGQIDINPEVNLNDITVEFEESDKEDLVHLLDYLGFILYDGTNEGEMALYKRTGLRHIWTWGDELQYSFIIKANGQGLYYDFTSTEEGESKDADDIFYCKLRKE